MKYLSKLSLFTLVLSATLAVAQTNLSQYVQHVIVVIQENRTPDNLFNQDSTLVANGAHVQPNVANTGPCTTITQSSTEIPLRPTPLWTCWDTGHNHTLPHPRLD